MVKPVTQLTSTQIKNTKLAGQSGITTFHRILHKLGQKLGHSII